MTTKRIGIALGSGGARGLAHVIVLEALDELGVRPHCISGSSIGALIGGLYASGLSAAELRRMVEKLVVLDERDPVERVKEVFQWVRFIDPDFNGGGVLRVEGFLDHLFSAIRVSTFEALKTPLRLAAADFWRREERVLESGPLIPAVQASMSLPGLFTPVRIDGRVLVDGGSVNPVPYDLLSDACDITIAVDVLGSRGGDGGIPSITDALFNTFQIMQQSILEAKMRHRPPTIYLKPEIGDVRLLELYKAKEIFAQALPAKEALKWRLGELLERE